MPPQHQSSQAIVAFCLLILLTYNARVAAAPETATEQAIIQIEGEVTIGPDSPPPPPERCPYEKSSRIFCPSPPGGGDETLYSSVKDSFPKIQCKKCNLVLSEDSESVNVKCYTCYEIPPFSLKTQTMPEYC